jgi:hypothetical protein
VVRIALAIVAVLAAGLAMASDAYCRVGSDGKLVIPKSQNAACPSGYYATNSARCCKASSPDTPPAFVKIPGESCPSGTRTSGGACVSPRAR